MSDHDNGLLLLLEKLIESLLNGMLTISVQGTCGLIEKKDARASNESSRDCNSLLLPARKARATFTNLGIEAIWEQPFVIEEATSCLL